MSDVIAWVQTLSRDQLKQEIAELEFLFSEADARRAAGEVLPAMFGEAFTLGQLRFQLIVMTDPDKAVDMSTRAGQIKWVQYQFPFLVPEHPY